MHAGDNIFEIIFLGVGRIGEATVAGSRQQAFGK